jgi:hypothetical protein
MPYRQIGREMVHEEKTSGNQPRAFQDLAAGDKKVAPTV